MDSIQSSSFFQGRPRRSPRPAPCRAGSAGAVPPAAGPGDAGGGGAEADAAALRAP